MENVPRIPSPLPAKLHAVGIRRTNEFYVWLRFDDGHRLELDFPPDSRETTELLEFVARITTAALSRMGAAGVVVNELTPAEEDEDEEDDE